MAFLEDTARQFKLRLYIYIKHKRYCFSCGGESHILLRYSLLHGVNFFFLPSSDLTRNRKHHHTSTSRLRQCFTMQEVKKLERFFEDTIGYPDTKTRRKLATEMQVSESKIQVIECFKVYTLIVCKVMDHSL